MGLIHLYSATSTSFDNNGTPLVTAREAVVKRDEGFQLTFSIPISQNELHKRVQKEMIVSAMTPDGVNCFRIWDIEKRTTDVKVTALQLLYSLDVKQINPFGGERHTGDSVLQAFVSSFKSSISPYTFSSSIITQREFHTNEEDDASTSHNALAILNKITDTWSGELMLNGFDVRMISKLGTKTDALLYEHKNIASFSDSSSMNGIVTRIYATATYTPERAEDATEDPEPVVLTATVDSPLINQYAVIYEATMEYNDARTVAELRTEILKQYSEFNVDKPERTIDVDTNIVDGTAINFGDELVLKYLVHDVDEVIRCVGYEYDPISENYIGVTLGTLEKTFLTKVTEGISSAVTRQLDKLNKQIQVVQTAANGKNRVTYGPNPVPNPIEGDLWFKHPEGRPDEIELLIYQNGLWLPAPFLTDQDKAEFEQELEDYQNAVLAEVALKDQEYKEIFEGYDEKVLTIDQEIADAATKAQSALEEAGVSTDLAQTANDLAAIAQANANTAKTNASAAQADASAAVTNANQAKADAQTAIEEANTAIANASQAKTDAGTALTQAGQAITSSNTAKADAQTALNNASTAITNASQAKTDSQTAMTNANQAKEDASQALTNASTAITNASQAKTDASKAVTDAQTAIAQSGQAVSSANTAKTNAQTAINDAQTALDSAQTALDSAQTALTTAGSADTKAGQAIAKANAIPTTITDIISDKNLVNGTYVDTKVNNATGAWSQELVRVEGVIDGLEIGGRNYATKNSYHSGKTLYGGGVGHIGSLSNNNDRISYEVLVEPDTDYELTIHGDGYYHRLGEFSLSSDEFIVDTATYSSNLKTMSLKTSLSTERLIISIHNNGKGFPIPFEDVLFKLEKGNKATDWTPAPEDLYSQEEFKIFNAQYAQDVTGITGRLTTVENTKLDGSTFQTFKQAEYQVTADKVASTMTRVDTAEGKITTHDTAISQNATAIASKANTTTVDALAGRVDTAESDISQNATAITQRVTTTTYNTGLATKENSVLKQSTAPSHLNGRLWLDTSVTPNVLKRSTGTAWVKATPTTASEVGAYSSSQGNTLAGRVTTAETNITQTATAITSKADKTTVDALAGTVSTQGTTITQQADLIESKANQSEVDTVKGTVSGHTTTLSQHATAIASKAEKSVVDTIKGTVDNHTTDISQNATDIATKASASSVNTLTGRVGTAESNISQNATAITQRVTTTTYNTGIASKENTVVKQSTAPTHANGKLWLDTSTTPNVLKRSNGTAWIKATPTTASEVGAYSQSDGAGLAGRLTTAETNITQTSTAITSKADKSVVDTLSGTVSTHTTTLSQQATAISSKADKTVVDTIKGTVDNHTTEIAQNATDIATKASASSVNTLTGRVDTAESNISQNATAITQRVTTTTYNSGIASKENTVLKQSAAPAHLNGRLWLDTSVTPNVLKRSNGTTWIKATPTTPGEVGAYSQSDGAGLAGRLTTAETSITQTATAITSKADKSTVDTLAGTVSTHTTEIAQNATAIASKASSTSVNTLTGRVSTAESNISQNATDIASKASTSSVNTLTGRVDTAESNISQNATAISQRVTTTTYDSGIASKEDTVLKQSTAPTHSNGRLWLDTSVTPNILKRSTGSAWVKATPTTASEVGAYSSSQGSALAGRVTTAETNITQTSEAITSKADKSVVDTLSGTVSNQGTLISQNATAITSKASTSSVNTLTGRVSTAETTISQHATAITSKASQTEVDTVKGTVSGHTSTLSQHATQISARLTSTQVNNLVDGKGLAKVTYVDNQISTTAQGITATLSSIESEIENLTADNLALETTDVWQAIAWTEWNRWVNTNIPVTGGEAYTLSVTAKDANYNIGLSIFEYDNNNTKLREHNDTSMWWDTLTGEHRKSLSATLLPNTTKIWIGFRTTNRTEGITKKITYKEFTLNKGSKSYPWNRNVEDSLTKDSFEVFKSEYQVTSQGFSAEISRVENKIPSLNGYATTTYVGSQLSSKAGEILAEVSKVEGKVVTSNLHPNTSDQWITRTWNAQWNAYVDDGEYGVSGDPIYIPVTAGEVYTASAGYSSVQTHAVGVKILWYSSDGSFVESPTGGLIQPGKGGWVSITAEAPQGSVNARVSLRRTAGGDGGVSRANVRCVKFEKNGYRTEWEPAWQDSASLIALSKLEVDLSGVKSTVQDNKGNVSTLTQQSNALIAKVGSNGEKIAQMVMTDNLFQSSVADVLGGNLATVAKADWEVYGWRGWNGIIDGDIPVEGSTLYTLSATGKDASGNIGLLFFEYDANGVRTENYVTSNWWQSLAGERSVSVSWTTKPTTVNVQIGFRGSHNNVDYPHTVTYKEYKLEKGYKTAWTPPVAGMSTKVSQLSNSWALTLRSGNDIKTQINASTDGIRLASKFIHLSGTSLIDSAVIKSAMIDTLNVSKLYGTIAEFAALRANVITAGSISADRLVSGTALVDRVFVDTAAINRLTSKTAFINNIQAISIDVGKITGNTASFISAGFKSLNSQSTINGHAIRIQNSAGEFVEMNNTPELRSDDAGGTAVVLGKGRVHFYDSRGYSKGYVGTDMHTTGSYDFGTFLSKGSGIYKFARMADATQTTYAYYTIKSGITSPSGIITNMVQNGYLPDGNAQQFVAKGNMLSQLNGWPNYPNWPTLTAGQQIRYKELTTQTTGDAYEDIWKFGPSSQGDWRIYFAKHATFEGGTTGTSDRRLKHDIETTQVEALHHIESLTFKEFKWNRDNKYEPIGLIAQDSGIIRVADDDMEGIDIQRAIMLGLKGVQELQALVKEQAAKIKQLEEINNQ